jgi:tripartite-type tricarboxylate transporter receptor subunit TctC
MKRLCRWLAAVSVLALAPPGAHAQQYPSQDIHIICAVPAGSGADVFVRFFAERMRPLSGRNIIVENKIGALGNIAAEHTVRSKPDGHTIHIHSVSVVAANYSLLKTPPFNPSVDLRAVAALHQQPFMVVVPADSPYKTLPELTAAMKAKGDKANYGHSNATAKVMGELYKAATGITALDIPYRIAPDALNDYASGRLDYGMMDPVTSITQSAAGKLRMLASSTSERLKAVPDLPTMKESGVPVELVLWFGAMVPAATPEPAVQLISKWISEIAAMEETQKFLAGFGSDPWILTPDQAQKQFVKDQKDWAEYIKIAKIPPQ